MNKITFFPRQVLRIECVRSTRLGEFWSRCLLSGPYWRLYLHSDHGAGIRIDGEKHELAPDKLHLLPPNCNLQTWCDNPEVKQLYLHFETPCLRGSRCICNTIELTPDLRVLTDRLNTLSDEETPLRMLHATALASSALTRLPPEALESHICDHQMQQLANLMRDSPGHPCSVRELAARAGIGVNELIRRFRVALGTPPYQYLTAIRYSNAARLLEERRLSIDEISEAVGIRDRFHFSRTFKRLYGCTPAAYRRGEG